MKSAPKDLQLNSRYRRAILERCATDIAFREECYIRASRDIIWFFDVFLWTYSPADHSAADCKSGPDRPFVLWDYQEETIHKLIKSIGKYSLLCEKSREMGLSWIVLGVFLWLFMFRPGLSFLLGSRKESLVDKTGDPKTLFWKIDYMLEKLPKWMQPSCDRTILHIANLGNGSVIDGESCNDDFARGDRRTAILLDEFPAVDNGNLILNAAGDATRCCIFVGTSQGASGAYFQVREKLLVSNPDRVIRLHWSRHPTKRLGMYRSDRKDTSSPYELIIVDSKYEFPKGYNYILDGKLRSPAYDERENLTPNKQTMAQEWDIDYLASGWQFFDQEAITKQLDKFAMEPPWCGELLFTRSWEYPEFVENQAARLKLWFAPDLDGRPPIDWKDCIAGVDIGSGSGGSMTSNSVVSVWRSNTGEKIAEFATQNLMPPDFALYALALCKWFNDAYLIWEASGPVGAQFGKVVKDEGYRHIFYSEDETSMIRHKTKKPGFYTDGKNKAILLSAYGTALKTNTAINRSKMALLECREYVNDGADKIIHVKSKNNPDPSSSGQNHGDRVIADALAVRGFDDLKKSRSEPEKGTPPPFSFGARQRAKETERAVEKRRRPLGDWSKFNY